MAAPPRPDEFAERVRRDAQRSVVRVRNGLKHLAGVGRQAVGQTPRELIWSSEKVRLWRYHDGKQTTATPVLFVHSLVSRSYLWDLVPGNSFVAAMIDHGLDVYLLDWGVPDELESGNTLETYSDLYLPAAIRRVAAASQSDDVNVFGYCFGGVLALLGVAGNPELPVRSLAVMATPVDFTDAGPLTKAIRDGSINPADLIDVTGNAPPDVMRNVFRVLQPTGDINGYVNLWQHLWNDDYVAAHQVMTRWSNDHIPFPGDAFLQTSDLLVRQNLLATGRIPLGGRTVDLNDITVPFVNIMGEKDHIVPTSASSPLTALVGSDEAEEIRLRAGHIGLIAGRSAHQRNIPVMANWLHHHGVKR